MIKDPNVNIKFEEKDKIILIANHNHFVRVAIATAADLFVTSLIVGIISTLSTVILLYLAEALDNNSKSTGQTLAVLGISVPVIAGLFYIIYFIVKIVRISRLRKKVDHIEDRFIKARLVGEATAETVDAPADASWENGAAA